MPIHIIIPAHNEAANIIHCTDALTKLYPNNPITIATDGNTDATTEIALEQELTHTNLFVQNYPNRIGKGAAIQQALHLGTINAYIDADLATNPYILTPMIQIAKQTKGLVIAKRHPTNRNLKRTLTSKLYNTTVRLLFNTGITDHQCGCKVLSPKATIIALNIEATDFFFDTELIIRCKKAGIPITEYPTAWTEHKQKSTVNITKDGYKMLKKLIKLRFKKL